MKAASYSDTSTPIRHYSRLNIPEYSTTGFNNSARKNFHEFDAFIADLDIN